MERGGPSVKPLYRRALAREKKFEYAAALKDAEDACQFTSDNPELTELRRRLEQACSGGKPSSAAVEELSSSTSPSSEAAGSRSAASARGKIPARSINAPSIPASAPKNSFELLRHFNTMKKFPSTLARYIRERVPPPMVQTLFTRTPIEADDLGTLLDALKTNVEEEPDSFAPALVAEYLQHLLRTRIAETQFAMLSSKEKEALRGLLKYVQAAAVPGEEKLRSTFSSIL